MSKSQNRVYQCLPYGYFSDQIDVAIGFSFAFTVLIPRLQKIY